ncbi:MAG: ABC transporter permease subunit [Acidaminococcaceae bacterium]
MANFKFLFGSGNAWIITRNTILYNVAFIIIGTVVPIAAAILFNSIQRPFAKKFYQTSILLPYLMSMVVVSYLTFAFLSADTGYVNKTILPMLGNSESINFYQEKKYWPYILIFVNQWKSLGFGMVIYLASILGISPDLYEAAKVDGAGQWKQIIYITLPSLKPTIITLFVLNMGRMFYSDFGLFYQVPRNSGMLYDVTMTIDVYVYNALMGRNNMGMSSAAGFYQSIVGFAMVILSNMLIRKLSREDALF